MYKTTIELINSTKDNNLFRSLLNLFQQFWIYNKKQLYLVGGCVRDLLLGKEPKDYDLTTNATPDEVKKIITKIGLKSFDSGIKHGTITVIDDFYKQSYEITTYRVDGKYTDGRHPDNVSFTPSLEEDLKRRDFTINSFAYNLLTKELVMLDESYLKDLEYGIIRTVGNAEDRFNEDALRMLRALRFMAQLNFTISKDTYEAIKKLCSNISKISKERIRDELTKILLSDNPQVLELIITSGLEDYLFNGITPFKNILNCPHQNPWHYTDVFHHTMDVVKRVPKTFELRWSAAFHDLGKPKVKKQRPQGPEGHFVYYDHPEESERIALELMQLLKFSNDQIDKICKFVRYHDVELVECKNSIFKKILVDIGKENFLEFMKLKVADAMAHELKKDTKYAIDYPDKIYKRFDTIIIEDNALTVKDLAINGNDIIADGFLQGKEIGDCLKWMLEIVLEHPEFNNREKLLELLELFKEMSFQST